MQVLPQISNANLEIIIRIADYPNEHNIRYARNPSYFIWGLGSKHIQIIW